MTSRERPYTYMNMNSKNDNKQVLEMDTLSGELRASGQIFNPINESRSSSDDVIMFVVVVCNTYVY